MCHHPSNPPKYYASSHHLVPVISPAQQKMHSKHDPNPRHTMVSTYKPRFHSSSTQPRLSTHHRPTTWPEHHAALILGLRDVTNPPTKTPDPDVRDFDVDRQIHARWTDPGIVDALVGAFLLRFVASEANALRWFSHSDKTETDILVTTPRLPASENKVFVYIRRPRCH